MKNQTNTQAKKQEFVSVPVPAEVKVNLRILAARKNQTMAEYVRDLILTTLDQQKQPA